MKFHQTNANLNEIVNDSIIRLLKYIEDRNYRGYDPYDALKSPLLQLPLLNQSKILRFGIQQGVKRLPVNIRPLLFVPKGQNPVTLGLCIQSYAALTDIFPEREAEFSEKANTLISKLEAMIPEGFHGACWGYDFPWEARHASIPDWQPTVVATGIITNALYCFYKKSQNERALSLIRSAASFVVHDLKRTYEGNNFCFSYSPFDNQQVYNASAKGARLLAQAYKITGDNLFKDTAREAIEYLVNRQQPDGSWSYSESGKWVDNYHTGYVIDCLDEYRQATGDETVGFNIKKGFDFYKVHFISPEGIPKFRHNKTFPVDCTAAGQLLLTLSRFGEHQIAERVATWMIENMQSDSGYFYYRKYPSFTQKISFMRWSNAWMLVGLSSMVGMLNLLKK